MKKSLLYMLFALVAFAACQTQVERDPKVVGQWQGNEWLFGDQPSGMDATKVQFEFKADGAYSAQFGNQNQTGTWYTESGKLYTQETGKQEIMVKILKLDDSSLEFEMNRGGRQETLKLKRK
jgi:Lipocalin-like domain